MMYSFPDLEPVCCSMYSSNCCCLTCIQISQKAGQVIWYSHLFKNFPQLWSTQWKADVFLELSCFFDDPADVGNLISGSSAFSQSSLNIWKFVVHILLNPGLQNFKHYFTSVWDEYNCGGSLSILWHCLSLGLEWKLTFSGPVAAAEFSKFAGLLYFHSIIF